MKMTKEKYIRFMEKQSNRNTSTYIYLNVRNDIINKNIQMNCNITTQMIKYY